MKKRGKKTQQQEQQPVKTQWEKDVVVHERMR